MGRVVQNNLSSLCTAHQITKYFINTCWLYKSICLAKRIMLIGSRYTQVYLFFTAQKIKYIVLMASRYTGTLLRRTLSRWNCVSDRVIQSISVMCSPCVLCSLKWTPSKDTCWPGNIVCKYSASAGVVWPFYQYLRNRSTVFASNLSISGCSLELVSSWSVKSR